MFRRNQVAAAAVLLLAGVGAWQAAANTSPVATGPISLVGTVTSHEVQYRRETWYMSLASVRRKGRSFGYMVMACVLIRDGSTIRQCVGTLSLPRGKITIAGSFLYSLFYELAVTGGTADYSGVGGHIDARRFPRAPANYWLTVSLQ